MRSKVYFMRHGEAYWNVMGKMQGQVNIPLTARGRQQAEQAARLLEGIPFSLCFSSPLSRAYETAEIALAGRDVPIVKEPLLMEQAYGVAEGSSHEGFSLQGSAVFGYETQPELYVAPIGGESFDQLYERIRHFFDKVLVPATQTHAHILVVAHGAVLCALANMIAGERPIASFWKRELPNGGIGSFELKRDTVAPESLRLRIS
ncbi:MAG: histidine phosphatase family protein, partial [Olegusella sp.]|nr:histidine phosphatase family protein [Olegusella sp.]